MANYSEATQVPFGDGSHVPMEDSSREALQPDITMLTAMKNIFTACDPSNTNSAHVSSLIDYMSPHMQEHMTALSLLQKALDPEGVNPSIDSKTFFEAMMKWTCEVVEDVADDVPVRDMDTKDESPSYTSGVVHLLRSHADGNSLNSSSHSCLDSSITDISSLQDKISELEYHNRKLLDEVNRYRTQLVSSEEQNDSLQTDVDRITRRLFTEQQSNVHLEQNRQNVEELIEASIAAQRQIGKLEKDLVTSEKRASNLKKRVSDLEKDKQKYEDRINQLVKNETESRKMILNMQKELDAKDDLITLLEDQSVQLTNKMTELQQMVTHYVDVNVSLKEENVSLQQQFHQAVKSGILSPHNRSLSNTHTECSVRSGTPQGSHLRAKPRVSVSPYLKDVFNSPRLLNMLANPVTSYLDNSLLTSSSCCKKSVDSINSPVFPAAGEVDSVFVEAASTPERCTRTLLDQTPPTTVCKLPVLTPLCIDLLKKPEYDDNLNIIRKEETVAVEGTADNETLPTVYVLERTSMRPRSKSASYNATGHNASSSSEDEQLLWNLSQRLSPYQSLESELTHAKQLESENAVLKKTIDHMSHHVAPKKNSCSPEKLHTSYGSICRDLKAKVQELESDNNHKYIKIIDLMEEKEMLQKELKRINGKDTDEINRLKQNISELHHEKGRVQQELEQIKWEKQNADAVIKHMQSLQNECDTLQDLLKQSRQNSEDLGREFDKISNENSDLRAKVEKLKKKLCEVNGENSELNSKLQKLTADYKLHSSKASEQSGLYDEINAQLDEVMKENEELRAKQAEYSALEALEGQVNEYRSLLNTCEIQKDHISSLTRNNYDLAQSVSEKESQIINLREMLNQQNEWLKATDCASEPDMAKLFERNKKLNEKLVKYENLESENGDLRARLHSLEDANANVLTEFGVLTDELKTLKNAENKLKKDIEKLETEKDLAVKNTEKLGSDHKKLLKLKANLEIELTTLKADKDRLVEDNKTLHDLKTNLEEEFQSLKAEKDQLTKENEDLNKSLEATKSELNAIKAELEEVQNILTPNDNTNAVGALIDQITELEEINKTLQLKNESFAEELNSVRENYEHLSQVKERLTQDKESWERLKEKLLHTLKYAMFESEALNEEVKKLLGGEPVDTSLCDNCLALKSEVDDLKVRVTALQDQSKSQGSFDKMQIKMEKLKIKSEEELEREKENKSHLERAISELQVELHNSMQLHKKDKTNMTSKIMILEDQVEKLQVELLEVENEKNTLFKETSELKHKSESTIQERETKIKTLTKENTQLKQEVQDLNKQKSALDRKLETAQNLLKCKLSVDKVNKENLQLKQDIEEVARQKAMAESKLQQFQLELQEKLDSDGTIKSCLEAIAKENIALKTKIDCLEQQKAETKKTLEKVQRDLQKSEARNFSIRKELTDIQSGRNDAGAKHEVEMAGQVKDCSGYLHLDPEYLKNIKDNVNDKRKLLNGSTSKVICNWRLTLENSCFDLKDLINSEVFSQEFVSADSFEQEMVQFAHQVKITTLVLDVIGTLAEESRSKERKDVGIQTVPLEGFSAAQGDGAIILDNSGCISPDSPSMIDLNSEDMPFENGFLNNNFDKNDEDIYDENLLIEEVKCCSKRREFYISSLCISDSNLESLGLLSEGCSAKWSKKEVEEKFTSLVAQFMVDVVSVKKRCSQQEDCQSMLENQFRVETEKLVSALTSVRKQSENCQLHGLLNCSLRQVRTLASLFAQITASAMLFGGLQYEDRYFRVISVMINHAANLRQLVDSTAPRLRSISVKNIGKRRSFTKTTPSTKEIEHAVGDSIQPTISNTSNTSASEKDSSHSQDAIKSFSEEVISHAAILSPSILSVKSRKNRTFLTCGVLVHCFYITLLMMLGFLFLSMALNCSCSWDEVFPLFVKRSYPNGPPPI